MKTILFCKRVDLLLQAAALLWGIALSATGDAGYLPAYFAVGSVQVLSMLLHLPSRRSPWISKLRVFHAWGTAALGGLAVAAFCWEAWRDGIGQNNLSLAALYASLLAAPFLAVGYAMLCWRETFRVLRFANRRLFL